MSFKLLVLDRLTIKLKINVLPRLDCIASSVFCPFPYSCLCICFYFLFLFYMIFIVSPRYCSVTERLRPSVCEQKGRRVYNVVTASLSLVNVPGFGTRHSWYLWSGKEDYNRVIKGEGIRFWPVRAFNFMCVLLSFFYTCTLQLSHL